MKLSKEDKHEKNIMSVERRKFREAMDPTLAWRRKAKAAKHSAKNRKKSKEAISALK